MDHLGVLISKWSTHQWNEDNPQYLDRAGGFFGAYVVFNLLLLLSLTIREQLQNKQSSLKQKSRNSITALVMVILMSLIPANFPQSHELRYFMFWMITVVSLNLYLVTSLQNQAPRWRWSQPKYLGLVCLLFLAIVCIRIDDYYLRPVFVVEPYLTDAVKPELLNQMTPNERTCLISRHAISNPNSVPFAQIHNAFYYSSYFHPEIKHEYSIKAAVDPRDCGDFKVIPANAQDFF